MWGKATIEWLSEVLIQGSDFGIFLGYTRDVSVYLRLQSGPIIL